MTNTPKSVLVSAANDCHYFTQEALTSDGKGVLPAGRNQTLLDKIVVPGGTTEVLSSVIPPSGTAIVIVGATVVASPMNASGSMFLAGVLRGNQLMGTSTNGYTTRTQATAPMHAPVSVEATTFSNLIQPGSAVVLADGNGANALWSAVSTATSPDTLTMYVEYMALNANDLNCSAT